MKTKQQSFLRGCKDVSLLLPGVVPFGVICGVTCAEAGMDVIHAMSMSTLMFAGASQIIVVKLMDANTPLLLVLFAGTLINLRMMMYSFSLANEWKDVGRMEKALLAYFLTDQAYATSMRKYRDLPAADPTPLQKSTYYLGAAIVMWIAFNAATISGAVLGSFIPVTWNLDFSIPLTFIALLIPMIKNRTEIWVAICSAILGLLCYTLPLNLGLIIATFTGIGLGVILEKRKHA